MRLDIDTLLKPRAIAVVGASERSSIAATIRANNMLLGARTSCHFVNPTRAEVDGVECFPDLASLPLVPDVAVLAVGPERAGAAARDAASAGVRAIVIPGGGMVEAGESARVMYDQVRKIAAEHELAVLGPNCMGAVDFGVGASTYIGPLSTSSRVGGVAAIVQSGSIADAVIQSGPRLGMRRIISCGVEIGLDLCDYLSYCLDDPECDTVALFLEGLRRPERFLALADRALAIGKPIIAVSVGRSSQAKEASLTHTGNLVGEFRTTEAALDATGVIRCADIDEWLETVALMSTRPRTWRCAPNGAGGVGVITASTGEASLIADTAADVGLTLPPIDKPTHERLRRRFPAMGYIGNPIDPWAVADPDTAYRETIDAMSDSGQFDVLCLAIDFPYSDPYPAGGSTEGSAMSLLSVGRRPEPILPVFVSLTSNDVPGDLLELVHSSPGAPILRGAREALLALSHMRVWDRRAENRASAAGPRRIEWEAEAAVCAPPSKDGDDTNSSATSTQLRALSEFASLELLETFGVSTAMPHRVGTADDAVAAATRAGFPVVVKVDAVGLTHKSDLNAVRTGLRDAEAVASAAAELLELELPDDVHRTGLLVAAMAEPGVEFIIGAKRDPAFGPVVLIGLGGVFAELLDEVAVSLAPLSPADVEAILSRHSLDRILRGFRGQPALDRQGLTNAVLAVSSAMTASPWIQEIDINPVIVSHNASVAVDALVVTCDVSTIPTGGEQ